MADLLRLRARVRRIDAANVFVRLSPSTASNLNHRAHQGSHSAGPSRGIHADGRSVSTSRSSPAGVEFLPLSITNERSNVTVFASYNGGTLLQDDEIAGMWSWFAQCTPVQNRKRSMIESVYITSESNCRLKQTVAFLLRSLAVAPSRVLLSFGLLANRFSIVCAHWFFLSFRFHHRGS